MKDPAVSEAVQAQLAERIRIASLKGGAVFGESNDIGIQGETMQQQQQYVGTIQPTETTMQIGGSSGNGHYA